MEDEIRIIGRVRGDDEDLIAIFDGHGGKDVAQYAATHLQEVRISSFSHLIFRLLARN